jgi:hypothetical protein
MIPREKEEEFSANECKRSHDERSKRPTNPRFGGYIFSEIPLESSKISLYDFTVARL